MKSPDDSSLSVFSSLDRGVHYRARTGKRCRPQRPSIFDRRVPLFRGTAPFGLKSLSVESRCASSTGGGPDYGVEVSVSFVEKGKKTRSSDPGGSTVSWNLVPTSLLPVSGVRSPFRYLDGSGVPTHGPYRARNESGRDEGGDGVPTGTYS